MAIHESLNGDIDKWGRVTLVSQHLNRYISPNLSGRMFYKRHDARHEPESQNLGRGWAKVDFRRVRWRIFHEGRYTRGFKSTQPRDIECGCTRLTRWRSGEVTLQLQTRKRRGLQSIFPIAGDEIPFCPRSPTASVSLPVARRKWANFETGGTLLYGQLSVNIC